MPSAQNCTHYHGYLDLSLHLLSPGQFLGLGDGCGQKLGFKGWLGSISDLLLRALSSDLLGGQLKKRDSRGSAR